ncbi:MAG: phosphatase PAP2 family protein [Dehalococcoidia bacterium]|nr:phosphatase PAP2 family protein [Dehalococcoidia bacterium]
MTIRTMSAARPLPFPAAARLAWVPSFGRDFGIVLAVIGVYFLGRGIAPTRIDFSVAVTEQLIAFEQSINIFWEPQVQEWSLRHHAVQEAANFVYAYLHFPVLALVGAWLWVRGRERFLFMRDVMFVSMVIGLVFYYAVPAAPPRLLAAHGYDFGFTDTVFGGNTSVQYAQPSLILNEYAAIPSFHFGWIALASAAIWVNTGSRVARTGAVLLTVVMSWAIVASANHFFVDMALGGLVIIVSWQVAKRLERRRQLRAAIVVFAARREVREAA